MIYIGARWFSVHISANEIQAKSTCYVEWGERIYDYILILLKWTAHFNMLHKSAYIIYATLTKIILTDCRKHIKHNTYHLHIITTQSLTENMLCAYGLTWCRLFQVFRIIWTHFLIYICFFFLSLSKIQWQLWSINECEM